MGEASVSRQTVFSRDRVPLAPVDPLYSLLSAYEADKSEKRVNLTVGAYRDDHDRPWILPVVKKANDILYNDLSSDHEYLPIAGLAEFCDAAQKLILGAESPAIHDKRVCTFQTVSGTGAVHLGALLLSEFLPQPTPSVYVSSPSWPIHDQVFSLVRLPVKHYPYFSAETKMMDFEGMMSALKGAPNGSIVLLHACAHNPTGVDPTEQQWKEIAEVIHTNHLFPFFDCAYQGFASGDLQQDNFAIRYFIEQGFEMIVAQSFAKNLGIYSQRVGAIHYIAPPGPDAQDTIQRVASHLSIFQRSEISSPPAYGAKIAAIILNDEQLFSEWQRDLQTMSSRIVEMRHSLTAELRRLGTPGTWDHITQQIGMFSFTGLSEAQISELRDKWHVYMATTGRISVAGLNTGNVKYFAAAVDDVVRRIKSDDTT